MKYSQIGKVLGWVGITVGATLLIVTFFIPSTEERISALLLGLGIALFPAGFFIILSDVNYSRATRLQIEKALNVSTRSLSTSIDSLKDSIEFLNKAKDLGIVMGFRNREEGLESFLRHLESYVSNPAIRDKKFFFVGSSLKGLLTTKDFGSRVSKMISDSNESEGGTDFYFLLTHPAYSRYREVQENRAKGDIAKEILHAILWLEQRKIPHQNVKVYKGTPTCFLMASTERMLINPYPYEIEAYKCFCLEVENNGRAESIFSSYIENHFNKPWKGQQHDRDHYMQPSALSYSWDYLDGPIASDKEEQLSLKDRIGDVLFIDDKASFYVAINISMLPKQLSYFDCQKKICVINVGDELIVKLLLRETEHWEDLGLIQLGSDRRDFWHTTVAEKAMSAYSFVGLFDSKHPNSLCREIGTGSEDQGLLLWKDIPMHNYWEQEPLRG